MLLPSLYCPLSPALYLNQALTSFCFLRAAGTRTCSTRTSNRPYILFIALIIRPLVGFIPINCFPSLSFHITTILSNGLFDPIVVHSPTEDVSACAADRVLTLSDVYAEPTAGGVSHGECFIRPVVYFILFHFFRSALYLSPPACAPVSFTLPPPPAPLPDL